MALTPCRECNREISDQAAACPHCGAPVARRPTSSYYGDQPAPALASPQLVKAAKSRGVYIILGLFFGMLGVHNFYAGRHGRGLWQLLCTLVLGWFVVGLIITFIWVVVDLFSVTTDGAGDSFA